MCKIINSEHETTRCSGNEPRRLVVVYNGHIAQHSNENQRVDRDVSDDVDDVVHHTACEITKRPVGRGELVRRQRGNDYDEHQVSSGDVQQQQVGVSTHARPRHNDVDDQCVAKDADERDKVEQRRNYNVVQDVFEVFAPLEGQQFVLV